MARGFQLLPLSSIHCALALTMALKANAAVAKASAEVSDVLAKEEETPAPEVAANEADVPTPHHPRQVFSLFLNLEVYKVPAY